ncbi:MAG: hypothetical protein IJ248_03275 [Candidatus Methanomethylophilaceae archaeon]|nr:hypothetical protein [Candidatus Methanomethylophilaceae archaeon]
MKTNMKVFLGVIAVVVMLTVPQALPALGVFAQSGNDRGQIGSEVDYAYSQSASNSVHYFYDYSYHDAYAATSIGYCTGHALHSGVWMYEVWFNGEMNSSGTYGWYNHEMLMASAFDVDVTQNTSACDLYVVNQTKHVWSTGGDLRDYDYDQYIANSMISGVLALISAAGGSPAWTIATTVAGALLNGGYHTKTVNTSSLWYLWQWSNGSNDAYDTMYFRADVDNGASTQITCNFHVFGMGFELLTAGPMVLNISAPSVRGISDPYLMTEEDRESCGIITVNKTNVDQYSSLLHISDVDIAEIKESNEDYFYTIGSITSETLTQEEVERRAVKTSESMIQYLEKEYELCQSVIDVFTDAVDEDQDYVQEVLSKRQNIKTWIEMAINNLKEGEDASSIMDDYKKLKN